jgi:glycosyltransferase involved in cell wall biosynthesis
VSTPSKRFSLEAQRQSTPFLSVVVAVRNAAHCIDGLLESYRRERTADTELIVLDGASNDGTWDALIRNRDIVDIATSEVDQGIYDAWNKALPMCRGQFVSFIGADDRIADGALGRLVVACRMDPDAHIVAGYNVSTRRGDPVALLGARFDAARLPERMLIAHVMSAHRLDWLNSVSGFDASYRSSGDYELLLRQRANLRIVVIPTILAYMEDGGMSRSSLLPHFENYRARRSNGIAAWRCATLFAKALAWSALRRMRMLS